MYRDRESEVVLSAGLLAKVEDSEMRIARHAGDNVWMMRTELRRVDA